MDDKIGDILKLTPQNLAEKQFYALKKHAINKLETIRSCIEREMFDEAGKMTSYSPAGDYMGSEVNYIDFDFGKEENDIGMLLDTLRLLKKLKDAKNEEA